MGYLKVPVWPGFSWPDYGGAIKLLRVLRDDEMIFEYYVPSSEGREDEPVWYASLPLQERYEVSRKEIAACGFDRMQSTDELPPERNYEYRVLTEDKKVKENCVFGAEPWSGKGALDDPRPAVHFTAQHGWINDPNGLIYDGKVWHLYCQHNPMDGAWCNMTWGHATSADLVHFSWEGDVLFPDSRGVMYSGSAILNAQKLGEKDSWKIFPELPEEALLFFYTSAGSVSKGTSSENSVFTQRAAFSVDGGRTLVKISDWELPHMAGENRDPKLILHKETRGLILVLYLDADRFGIFRAEAEGEDGPKFRLLQELRIPERIECPDFFPLTDLANGRTLWAFVSASGDYMLGEFDGFAFTPATNIKNLYANRIPFAAQSWSNAGGRALAIAWLRSFWTEHKTWTCSLSLVRELSLAEKEDGPYIRQRFVLEEGLSGQKLPEGVELRKLPDGAVEIVDSFGEDRIVERLSADGELLAVEYTLPEFPYPTYVEGETH